MHKIWKCVKMYSIKVKVTKAIAFKINVIPNRSLMWSIGAQELKIDLVSNESLIIVNEVILMASDSHAMYSSESHITY